MRHCCNFYSFEDTPSTVSDEPQRPAIIEMISGRHYVEIVSIIKSYRQHVISFIKFVRNVSALAIYTTQTIDNSVINQLSSAAASYVPIRTTGDGNYLFNAVSLCLFGHEKCSLQLKVASVFIMLE